MHSLTSLHVSLLHATKPSTFGLLSYVTLLTVRDPLEPMGPQGQIAQMDLCTREYLVLS